MSTRFYDTDLTGLVPVLRATAHHRAPCRPQSHSVGGACGLHAQKRVKRRERHILKSLRIFRNLLVRRSSDISI